MIIVADYGGREAVPRYFQADGLEDYVCTEARILDGTYDLAAFPLLRHGNKFGLAKNDSGSAAWLLEFEKQ